MILKAIYHHLNSFTSFLLLRGRTDHWFLMLAIKMIYIVSRMKRLNRAVVRKMLQN